MVVFAVCGEYDEATEVRSLWTTRELAQEEADRLNAISDGFWTVRSMPVNDAPGADRSPLDNHPRGDG